MPKSTVGYRRTLVLLADAKGTLWSPWRDRSMPDGWTLVGPRRWTREERHRERKRYDEMCGPVEVVQEGKPTLCPGCGEPIEQQLQGRRRKWCSDRCRMRMRRCSETP